MVTFMLSAVSMIAAAFMLSPTAAAVHGHKNGKATAEYDQQNTD